MIIIINPISSHTISLTKVFTYLVIIQMLSTLTICSSVNRIGEIQGKIPEHLQASDTKYKWYACLKITQRDVRIYLMNQG